MSRRLRAQQEELGHLEEEPEKPRVNEEEL